ncbi:Soluble aldose sugar dehydrogenase YliI precursor [Marinomonas spartinae]|uniref:Soluble aldose sugar dehydrogenase YliI n=1 Tax=Marinomonas spartinae TaxID=1792290 RepID=A0A1A8TJ95_9GAMM|nr:PQQ-dependent sugar dehydrogenase [Marinomonas spartinae]SBS33511.1 Soluble aldose sugar dehydrogenase YliI precursor [Marinomonas spartinae]
MKTWLLCISLLLSLQVDAQMVTTSGPLKVKQVTQFNGIPWGVTLLSNKEAIVTIKKGKAYRVDLKNGDKQILSGLPKVDNRGQGGLFDVAKAPNFEQSKLLYFTYAKPTPKGATTTLARAKLVGNKLTNWQDIFISDAATKTNRHFGGRIAFDDAGHVFFTIGDRGIRKNAQDLTNDAGSILRLTLDGKVPADNPFINNSRVRNAIWSYGHRNPQGIFYDTKDQKLWSNEHGPRGGDEINLIRRGANYGWPIVSHGKEYINNNPVGEAKEKDGIVKPLKVYIPSIAPSSLLRYRGKLFADWDGSFLSTALVLKHLNRIEMKDNNETKETRYLESLHERLRSMAESKDGALYIGTDSGKLLEVTPLQ